MFPGLDWRRMGRSPSLAGDQCRRMLGLLRRMMDGQGDDGVTSTLTASSNSKLAPFSLSHPVDNDNDENKETRTMSSGTITRAPHLTTRTEYQPPHIRHCIIPSISIPAYKVPIAKSSTPPEHPRTRTTTPSSLLLFPVVGACQAPLRKEAPQRVSRAHSQCGMR